MAKAIAHLRGSSIEIGYASVDASATAASARNVIALASLNAQAPGDVWFYDGFDVHAGASGRASYNVEATADANIKAGGFFDDAYGDVYVTASASSDGTRDGRANTVRANAQL